MDYVTDKYAIKVDVIEVDKETMDTVTSLGMVDLLGVVEQAEPLVGGGFMRQGGGYLGDAPKRYHKIVLLQRLQKR